MALLLLCWPFAAASAQPACPWLTEGTAAALLGGAVSFSAHTSAAEGSCEFVRHSAAAKDSAMGGTLILQITVGHQPPRECVQGERATGIGESSTLCTVDLSGKHMVVLRGRVRSEWFLVTLTEPADMAHNKVALRQSLEQIGEEVAGNLF